MFRLHPMIPSIFKALTDHDCLYYETDATIVSGLLRFVPADTHRPAHILINPDDLDSTPAHLRVFLRPISAFQPRPSFNKEQILDQQIVPLMKAIIAVCEEHEIPMVASFCYAAHPETGYEMCTTAIHHIRIPALQAAHLAIVKDRAKDL